MFRSVGKALILVDELQIEKEKYMKEGEISTSKGKIELVPPSLHATGLGIDVADFTAADSGNGSNVEEYYKKMVEENPNNPLFLRNYAQFLCQVRLCYSFSNFLLQLFIVSSF